MKTYIEAFNRDAFDLWKSTKEFEISFRCHFCFSVNDDEFFNARR